MKTLKAPQGSSQWLHERAKLITASRMKDVMSVLRDGSESAARLKYKLEIVGSRLTGYAADNYVSADMDRGTELEPIARSEYEVETETMVEQVGMVYHPTMDFCAASPDGLVGDKGAIELKAPRLHNHLSWVMADTVPSQHVHQCQWVMECCERDWLDFGSFEPSLPNGLRLFIVRIYRDEELLTKMRAAAQQFNDEIEAELFKLRNRIKLPSQPKVEEPAPELEAWPSAFDNFIRGEVTP